MVPLVGEMKLSRTTYRGKKSENSKRRKTSGMIGTLLNRNEIMENNMCSLTSEEILNISSMKSNKKSKGTCGFCKKIVDHKITNCPEKKKYGIVWSALDVMDYVRNRAPFKFVDPSMANNIIYDWDCKLVQHVVLHNIQCKINTNGKRSTINEMIVELTALGRNGQELPGYVRCLVFGPKVFFYIQSKDHVKDRFIFNKIEEESVGKEYQTMNTPETAQMNHTHPNQSNHFFMHGNNTDPNHISSLRNGNMMNNQYPFFPPNNMFACSMFPVGYNPFNQQMNFSNTEGNNNSRESMD